MSRSKMVFFLPVCMLVSTACMEAVEPYAEVGEGTYEALARGEEEGDTDLVPDPEPYRPRDATEGSVYPPEALEGVEESQYLHILRCGSGESETAGVQTSDTYSATAVRCGPTAPSFVATSSALMDATTEAATQLCVDQMRGTEDIDDPVQNHGLICVNSGECEGDGYCRARFENTPRSDTTVSSKGWCLSWADPANIRPPFWPDDVPFDRDHMCCEITVKCSGAFDMTFSCPCCDD